MFCFGRKGTGDEIAPEPRDEVGGQGNGTSGVSEGIRRLRLRFRGEVQGVGFRWSSRIVADKTGCTGWVRNDSDGTVAMELQGTDNQISRWFGGLSTSYAYHPIDYRIDEKDEIEPVSGERGFEVRFR